jgi:branched-chain amino acid transport system substrate-binding protein
MKQKDFSVLQADVERRAFVKGLAGAGAAFAQMTGYAPFALADNDVIRIGWIRATTGKAASTYAAIFSGGLVALDEINEAGGILGRKVEPYDVDDEGSPSTQPAVARRLVEETINIAVGPGGSSQGLASLAVTTPAKIVSAAYALSDEFGDAARYPYHYQFILNTRAQAEAAVRYLVDKRGAKKIGILHEQTAFGESLTKNTIDFLSKQGLKPTAVQAVPLSPTAVLPNMDNLRKSGAEAVCAWVSLLPAYGMTFKALADLDWAPVLCCHLSALSDTLFEMAPDKVFENAVATSYATLTWTENEPIGKRQMAYLEKIRTKPGMAGREAIAMMAPFYDFLHAIKLVAEDQKSLDSDALKSGLDALVNYDGMLGRSSFSAANHSGLSADNIALAKLLSARDARAYGAFRERA